MSLYSEQINICKKGNLDNIIALINQGYNKNNILLQVCSYGHIQVVKYLVEKCGVNVRVDNDWAVRHACANGHVEVVKYLVEKCKANVRANIDYAVRWACGAGHLQVIKYLIETHGVNARANSDFAVRWACGAGHLNIVKYLVEECGANARANTDNAIEWASESGHLEVIKYLIEKCGAILPEVNPRYERYIYVYEKGEKKRRCVMAKRIYFWWVQACYNPDFLCGQRSMYKGYREYLNMR